MAAPPQSVGVVLLCLLLVGGCGRPARALDALVRVAAVGDSGQENDNAAAVAAMIRDWEPLDAVVSLGDLK